MEYGTIHLPGLLHQQYPKLSTPADKYIFDLTGIAAKFILY